MSTEPTTEAHALTPDEESYLEKMNQVICLEDFLKQFRFGTYPPWTVAIRRQRFICGANEIGLIDGARFLGEINTSAVPKGIRSGWQYGLTTFQINHRTPFILHTKLKDMQSNMEEADQLAQLILRKHRWEFTYAEITHAALPQTFKPTAAYRRLAIRTDQALLEKAIRTCSTCIEVSMPNMETALKASNLMRDHIPRLAERTSATRRKYWSQLAEVSGKRPIPDEYASVEHFHEAAGYLGCLHDPIAMPHVANISPDGFLRMDFFGNSNDPKQVTLWVQEVLTVLAPLQSPTG